jgi:hypothetical protein
MSSARIEWLTIAGEIDAWRRLGLTVTEEGTVPFMFASLRIVEGDEPGLVGWAISGIPESVTSIDGLATEVVAPGAPMLPEHPNGGIELDHVVVLTSELERTSHAITAATGEPLKRIRELGSMRQGFHRVGRGGLIVELVERPEVVQELASFWGLVINVADLDAAVAMIGEDLVGAPGAAVQPGRRIATVRKEAGLGVPVALMSIS